MSSLISYLNASGYTVPSFGCISFLYDCDVAAATSVISAKAVRPTSGSSVYAFDSGKGSGISGPTAYGQAIIPKTSPTWAYYTGASAPGVAWMQEVGPHSDGFDLVVGGTGFVYAGSFDATNKRILVVSKNSSGGTCNTIRFRIGAPIAGTMSAICFIHSLDAGFTLADVPGKANLEFPGNPFPGMPNVIVCDPTCSYFNEPQAGLTNRLGWAKYMQPIVPNTCQPDAAYLSPQWEVFALNCVMNPLC